MNGLTRGRLGRSAIVIAILVSWLAISNHCAVAAVTTTKPDTTENECPFHPKPAKQKQESSNIQCCKILRALVAKTTKDWARDNFSFSDLDLPIASLIAFTEAHKSVPLLLDTGPPGTTSFVELIGSMRAHAPPVFA